MGQLKGLGDELNFPDPTSLKLDVKALTISRDMPINLMLGGPDAGKRISDRNIGPVDILLRGTGKAGKKRAGTCCRPAPNQSLKFPRLGRFAVVLKRFIQRT